MELVNRDVYPVPVADPGSVSAESYKTIRTNIELVSPTQPIRTILVTSARTGEGKTATVFNLGAAFAETHEKVLIVDADIRTGPSRLRETSPTRGLLHVLTSDTNFMEVVRRTTVTNLDILLSGVLRRSTAPSLSMYAFSSLLGELKCAYDVIIIDSSPVLDMSDTLTMIPSVDGVVFVVDATKTSRFIAQQAMASIQQIHGHILGGIVNRSPKHAQNRHHVFDYNGTAGAPARLYT